MELTKPKKFLAVGIVIVLIASVAAGAWYLNEDTNAKDPDNNDNDDEPSKDAKELASKFAANYTGEFGPFEVNSTSTSSHAVLVKENDSERLKYSRINYTVTPDAKSRFDQVKATIESMEPIMGASPTEIKNITGFDDICAYKFDVKMGMTQFTLIYFVAYVDDVLVECSEDPIYHPGSMATNTEIKEFFRAVSKSVSSGDNDDEPSKDAKELASKFAANYTGEFGPFEVNSTSTSSHAVLVKENGSPNLKYSKVNYNITSDAKSRFDQVKATIESMEPIMGASPTEIKNITGFDDICAYKFDVKMGMTQFTLIYFVAYVDDVLVEGSEDAMYHPGSQATETEITEFFEAISNSLSS